MCSSLSYRGPDFIVAVVVITAVGCAWRPAAVHGQESSTSASTSEASAEGGGSSSSSEGPEESETYFESEEELFETPESDEEEEEREETDEESGARPRDAKPVREMSREEASAAGFDFGDGERASERTTATFLAVTGGSVVHGVGHWYLGETRTSLFLLGTEGVGLALAGGGAALWFSQRNRSAGAAAAATAFHAGAGLFGTSYFLDVVGSILDGQGRRSVNPRDRRSLEFRADYRYLSARGYPLRHFFVGGLEFKFDRVFGGVQTDQDFELDGSNYDVELGLQWWRGNRPWTYAYLEGGGALLDFRGSGRFDRWSSELRAGLSLDLGFVAPHLEQVALGAEVGYGRAWYLLSEAESSLLESSLSTTYIPVEVYSHLNLGERLHLRLSYEKSAMRPLQATRRLGGVGGLSMRYDSTDLLDLEISSEFGGGFSVGAGLVLDVW